MADPAEPRSFPRPWRVVEREQCFIIEDANAQPLAYVYFEGEPVRRGLTYREAWRVASNIAKRPELLTRKVGLNLSELIRLSEFCQRRQTSVHHGSTDTPKRSARRFLPLPPCSCQTSLCSCRDLAKTVRSQQDQHCAALRRAL